MDASVIVESGSGKIGDEAVGRRVRSVSRIDYHPTLYNSVEERKALFETFGSSQIHVALPPSSRRSSARLARRLRRGGH